MYLGGSLSTETSHPLVRAGGGRTPGRLDRPARSARPRTDRARAQGADHRGLWRRGDLRRADRQVLRCRGERRVQHEERGDGPIARGRPRHRLHPRGLHPKWAQVRSHLPVGGDPFTVRVQERAQLQWDARNKQRRSSGESEGRWIGPVDRVIKALVLSPFVSQKMASFTVKPNKEDLEFLKQFIEDGTLTPEIDRIYPLAQVPEAIRYLEEGHARGKVVITL